mmetsp:Transcript_3902/g.11757  ORF Transcript_3902/g.11757 Transcript_3902/m.11757 type:complete len:233 (-) Transcript_3902:3247-3945(-)
MEHARSHHALHILGLRRDVPAGTVFCLVPSARRALADDPRRVDVACRHEPGRVPRQAPLGRDVDPGPDPDLLRGRAVGPGPGELGQRRYGSCETAAGDPGRVRAGARQAPRGSEGRGPLQVPARDLPEAAPRGGGGARAGEHGEAGGLGRRQIRGELRAGPGEDQDGEPVPQWLHPVPPTVCRAGNLARFLQGKAVGLLQVLPRTVEGRAFADDPCQAGDHFLRQDEVLKLA